MRQETSTDQRVIPCHMMLYSVMKAGRKRRKTDGVCLPKTLLMHNGDWLS